MGGQRIRCLSWYTVNKGAGHCISGEKLDSFYKPWSIGGALSEQGGRRLDRGGIPFGGGGSEMRGK